MLEQSVHELGPVDANIEGLLLGFLNGSLDGTGDCISDGLALRNRLGIAAKLVGALLGTNDGNLDRDGITLGLDKGTELGLLDGYFDGSNVGKLVGALLGRTDGNLD